MVAFHLEVFLERDLSAVVIREDGVNGYERTFSPLTRIGSRSGIAASCMLCATLLAIKIMMEVLGIRVVGASVQERTGLGERCYQILWSKDPADSPARKTPVL